jgi:curved DNA-binding protein CbpA
MPRNYYAVLRVSRNATSSAIHNAFRSLARQYHPDTGPDSSPERFCEIAEAYQVLSDPERRRQHDIELSPPVKRAHVVPEPLFADRRWSPNRVHTERSDLEDLLEEMFRILHSHFEFY